MTKFKRLIIQVALWLGIRFIISLNQNATNDILTENLLAFTFQVLLIVGLVYYTAPKFLFKRKFVLFSITSIIAIVVFSSILSSLFVPIEAQEFSPPPEFLHPPELSPLAPPLRNAPPRFLIHSLMLTISYILAIIIEGFIFLKAREEETILSNNANLQNELKLLKLQINPHFLFNSLNNIYTLAGIDSNKTQKSIINLSNMLRYVLYECDQETVLLNKEIEYIENYLKLFALKSSKIYPISTQFNIVNNAITIAPMLIIPFIENALKHSNINSSDGSFINIKIDADANEINFEVENSLPKTKIIKDEVGGIGLENVKKRLTILYPNKHQLMVSENENSFYVKLNLKYNEDY